MTEAGLGHSFALTARSIYLSVPAYLTCYFYSSVEVYCCRWFLSQRYIHVNIYIPLTVTGENVDLLPRAVIITARNLDDREFVRSSSLHHCR